MPWWLRTGLERSAHLSDRHPLRVPLSIQEIGEHLDLERH
jgi:hypothetical protein